MASGRSWEHAQTITCNQETWGQGSHSIYIITGSVKYPKNIKFKLELTSVSEHWKSIPPDHYGHGHWPEVWFYLQHESVYQNNNYLKSYVYLYLRLVLL